VTICSEDDDDIINDSWIYTVRASLNDNQLQSQHYEELEPVDSQHHSYAAVTSYGDRDVIPPRPITVVVSVHFCQQFVTNLPYSAERPEFSQI